MCEGRCILGGRLGRCGSIPTYVSLVLVQAGKRDGDKV